MNPFALSFGDFETFWHDADLDKKVFRITETSNWDKITRKVVIIGYTEIDGGDDYMLHLVDVTNLDLSTADGDKAFWARLEQPSQVELMILWNFLESSATYVEADQPRNFDQLDKEPPCDGESACCECNTRDCLERAKKSEANNPPCFFCEEGRFCIDCADREECWATDCDECSAYRPNDLIECAAPRPTFSSDPELITGVKPKEEWDDFDQQLADFTGEAIKKSTDEQDADEEDENKHPVCWKCFNPQVTHVANCSDCPNEEECSLLKCGNCQDTSCHLNHTAK